MNDTLLMTTIFAVKDLSNAELAAGNLSLSWLGNIPKTNQAYNKFVELELIKKDGSPIIPLDILTDALSRVINKRVEIGKWQNA